MRAEEPLSGNSRFAGRPIRRLRRLLLRTQAHLLFELNVEDAADPAPAEGLRFEAVCAENLATRHLLTNALIALNPDNDAYLDDIRKDRAVGLLIVDATRIVHYAYVFKKNKTARLLGLPRSTALIGNAFTIPGCRGRGLQAQSVHARARIAAAIGFRRVVAETSPDNRASQYGLRRAGMKPLGRVELLILLNCLVIRWKRPSGIRLFGFCP